MSNHLVILDYLTKQLDRAVLERDDVSIDVITKLILNATAHSRAERKAETNIAANRRAAGFFNPDDNTRREED